MSENIAKQLQLLDGEDDPYCNEDPLYLPSPTDDRCNKGLQQRGLGRTEFMQAEQRAKQQKDQEKKAMLDKKKIEWESIEASPFAFHLFDMDEVDRRIALVEGERDSEACMKCLQAMKATGGYALLVPQPVDYETILDELKLDSPHFESVIEFIRMRMRLNGLKDVPSLTFESNILLDGPAGIGKTSFLMALSEKINTTFYSFSCASVTNSFSVTGLSGGYAHGRAGKLHELLAIRQCPNPIILLDEIEKTGFADDRHSITGALYGLLEKNNAREFKDEFIDVKMDASRINWFATSNHASRLDEALRDRFEVIQVRAPHQSELRLMIPRIYQRLVIDMELGGVFVPHLGDNMLDYLSDIDGGSIRQVKAMLMRAMGCAAARTSEHSGQAVMLDESDIAPLKREQLQAHERRMNYII